ncbi:hypothetical protein [Streptomyces sp. NRRL S-813]|uniref:hypothetical protein n=1 Tax=Streptomyces sp. NRRL S-813 TaxID=1463919 RepID=UPI0004C11CA4|nr:hypothetical protein [Streptomyces sp. NRRL S-813]
MPVLLSLEGWNPADETAVDWAARRLCGEYTLFRRRGGGKQARKLLEAGSIALFLDGLDEVGGRVREAVVSALEPAPFRILLISRAREAVLTSKKARLGGAAALELLPVPREEAAAYLLHPLPEPPPPSWRRLTAQLLDEREADAPTVRALSSPLAIALLWEAYGTDGPVEELLDRSRFPGPRAVEDHLLDSAVTAAYTPRPGYRRPRHSPEQAERTLRYIARRLSEDGTRDLRWWHMPGWLPARPRTVVVGVLVFLLQMVFCLLLVPPIVGVGRTMYVAPWFSAIGGFVAGKLVRLMSTPQPLPSAALRDLFPPKSLQYGVVHWLLIGTGLWTGSILTGSGLPLWLCYAGTVPCGFVAMLTRGGGHGLVAFVPLSVGSGPSWDDMRREALPRLSTETRSIGPHDVWRHHIGSRLAVGLLAGLGLTYCLGALSVIWFGLWRGAVFAGSLTLPIALLSGPVGNIGVNTVLTAVQLAASRGTPVRLLSFLEDARRRNLLRATGPVYQFRHARLQERLAGSSGPGSPPERTTPGSSPP